MSQKGWVKLHRSIQEHWLWNNDKPFDKRSAWLDILMLVNHEKNTVYFNNEIVEVDRGEHITSEVKLAERWGWSRTKVRNFFKILEQDNMLKVSKKNKKRTRLKVLNYGVYQSSGNNRKTTEEQEENNRKTTGEHKQELKEVKNLKNEKKRKGKTVPHSDYSDVYNYATQKIKAVNLAKAYLIREDLKEHSAELLKKSVDLAVAAKEERDEYQGGNEKAGVNISSYKYIRCFIQEAKELLKEAGNNGGGKDNSTGKEEKDWDAGAPPGFFIN